MYLKDPNTYDLKQPACQKDVTYASQEPELMDTESTRPRSSLQRRPMSSLGRHMGAGLKGAVYEGHKLCFRLLCEYEQV